MKHATFKPQVLQVELHAYFQQKELREFCEQHDIILTAYAPLGSPGAKNHFVTKYKYRWLFMHLFAFYYAQQNIVMFSKK